MREAHLHSSEPRHYCGAGWPGFARYCLPYTACLLAHAGKFVVIESSCHCIGLRHLRHKTQDGFCAWITTRQDDHPHTDTRRSLRSATGRDWTAFRCRLINSLLDFERVVTNSRSRYVANGDDLLHVAAVAQSQSLRARSLGLLRNSFPSVSSPGVVTREVGESWRGGRG
nr:hypothetical protein CFP56_09912 [Quercus suber]